MTSESRQDVCPTCGGPLERKQVEKLLRGGVNTAVMSVAADVCQRCGERLYEPDVVRRFEEVRDKLARKETTGFVPLEQSFEVLDSPTSSSLS
jgi:YgiT-type zinc finger domain-containing protein